ncbi:hypothetical protein IV102_07670 [bacterium]|nr:hypothetical protein [bacterium]
MDIDEKLDEIRNQSKEDFKFIMIAFDNSTKAMVEMNKLIGVVTHEMGTVKAKMARQEERFELMLDAIQREMKNRVDPIVVADHERRIQALERKENPAA